MSVMGRLMARMMGGYQCMTLLLIRSFNSSLLEKTYLRPSLCNSLSACTNILLNHCLYGKDGYVAYTGSCVLCRYWHFSVRMSMFFLLLEVYFSSMDDYNDYIGLRHWYSYYK